MKRRKINYSKCFSLFFAIAVLIFIAGCNGVSPAVPIVNSFLVSPTTITMGDSSTLSWSVTDAATVIIDQGVGSVASTGTTVVSPITTTTYTLTATNVTGSSTAEATITVSPAIVEQAITIQPDPNEGKDSTVSSTLPDHNSFKHVKFRIGKWGDTIYRSYLQFDLSNLPADAVIIHTDLKLYQSSTNGTEDFTIGAFKVDSNWEENTITWNNQPGYNPIPESINPVILDDSTWLSWDISSLMQGWVDGSIANHGIALVATTDISFSEVFFSSSDYLDIPGQRPKLEITYYVP